MNHMQEEITHVMEASHTSFKVITTGLHVHLIILILGYLQIDLSLAFVVMTGSLKSYVLTASDMKTLHKFKEDEFYLKKTTKGLKSLEIHKYYFQIQGNWPHICEYSYSDFVCWTSLH